MSHSESEGYQIFFITKVIPTEFQNTLDSLSPQNPIELHPDTNYIHMNNRVFFAYLRKSDVRALSIVQGKSATKICFNLQEKTELITEDNINELEPTNTVIFSNLSIKLHSNISNFEAITNEESMRVLILCAPNNSCYIYYCVEEV